MTTTHADRTSDARSQRATAQPILVTTDGRHQSDCALEGALAIAGPEDAVVTLAVLEPAPILTPEVPFTVSPDIERKRETDLRARATAQAARTLGTERPAVEVRVGDPPLVIAATARELDARLIVVGLGQHGVVERLFGDETALQLLRLSDVPVLAVTKDFVRRPRRVVVAVDFSATSTRAARQAIELAADSAEIHLVHVVPRGTALTAWESWAFDYKREVESEFRKLEARLSHPRGMKLERTTIEGDPARQILAYADRIKADMIATGTHGQGFIARLVLGSVATKILRGARCTVLGMPHEMPPVRDRAMPASARAEHAPQAEWRAALDDFTRRNVGRRALLEVDDPRVGAQAQASDFIFLGATYDPNDGRVSLMFGELGAGNPHLTRSIGGVDAVDVLQDAAGGPVALRLAHGPGQTLVTFE